MLLLPITGCGTWKQTIHLCVEVKAPGLQTPEGQKIDTLAKLEYILERAPDPVKPAS